MKLISRITVQRYELGEISAREGQHDSAGKSFAIFKVLGRFPERVQEILLSEMSSPERTVVLSIAESTLSEGQRTTCQSVLSQGLRQSKRVVFCGGDPSQIFGHHPENASALGWFPSLQAFLAAQESHSAARQPPTPRA